MHEPYLGCGDGWVCKPVAHRGAGITRARVGTFDSGFAVIIERTGGETVMIIADRGFGNDFTAAIDGFPFEVDELVAAASDPRLDLAP